MLSIFVFSNSFIERMIIWNLDFLLKCKINKICLLKENHSSEDVSLHNYAYNILICNTLEECILNSDIVLIIKNKNLPEISIDKILQYVKIHKKEIHIISNPFTEYPVHFNDEPFNSMKQEFERKPVILTVSLGIVTQPYCIEILMDKMFLQQKIRIKHLYTKQTMDFFVDLNTCGLLNKSIAKKIHKPQYYNDYEIIICSINIGDDIYNITKYMDTIRSIQADYVILQVDKKFDDYENAINFFKYGCLSPINIIVKSKYITINNKNYVYIYSSNSDSIAKDIESPSLASELYEDILLKISLPTGMKSVF